jgi:uncharacterized protein YecT (DUF1311 family)
MKWISFVSLMVSLTIVGSNSGPVCAELQQDSAATLNEIAQRQPNCNNPRSDIEIKECIRLRYEAAARRLNDVYKQLLSKLSREERALLAEEQQRWIQLKENNCEFEVYESRGASGYRGFLNQCLERMTKQRTAELESYLRQSATNPAPSQRQQDAIGRSPSPSQQITTGRSLLLQEQGVLASGDSVLPSDNSLYDQYTFQGTAGQSITVTVESSDFDTYVAVFSPDGKLLRENDDINQSSKNSGLTVTIPSNGTYRVIVNGYDNKSRGRYALSVSTPTQRSAINPAPSQRQQDATGRSPSPSQQNTGERSLLVVANPQSIRGVNVPPADKSPSQLLSGYGFILDKPNAIKLNDGTAVYSIDVYNTGYADGVVEVYDARNKLIEVRGITGIRNPATNLYGFPIEGANRLFRLLTEGYGFTDPRNAIGRSQKTEIRNIAIPPGGRMIFTKNGERAMIYNQATFAIGVLSDTVLPKIVDANNLSFKSKLLSSLFTEIQKERVGSLIKDGMFLTLQDSQRAFVNQSWINEQNISYLMATGSKVLAQELAKSGVEQTVINQLVLGSKLNFWVTAAETFAQGSNIFLQWLDLDRSQKWEQQIAEPFGIANNK